MPAAELAVTVWYPAAPGTRNDIVSWFPAPGWPPEPALSRAPQYRPAHNTDDPEGRVSCDIDELRVDASPSASRCVMTNALLSTAAPFRAAAQLPADAGQVSRLLPNEMIAPFALVENRAVNGTVGSAAVGTGGTANTPMTSNPARTTAKRRSATFRMYRPSAARPRVFR